MDCVFKAHTIPDSVENEEIGPVHPVRITPVLASVEVFELVPHINPRKNF
jgi:hypothetical protein